MNTNQSLARIGAVSAFVGAVALFVCTLLHPLSSDPNDAPAAFAEYAANSPYVWTHLGQFVGLTLLSVALVALAATIEPGRAAAWARIGLAGTAANIAVATTLQAVDGVALKNTVDRWAVAAADARMAAFEAALAVRQIEIGLASLLSVLVGLTLIVFSFATLLSARYPNWLGAIGLLCGLGVVVAGTAQAATGFSAMAMMISMATSSLLLIWVIVAGILMWRLSPQLRGDGEAA